jgi:hypothetical protein
VFGINKRAAHVPLSSFRQESIAFEHVAGIGRTIASEDESGNKIVLNGMWDFQLFPMPEKVPHGFWMPDSSLPGWKQVCTCTTFASQSH